MNIELSQLINKFHLNVGYFYDSPSIMTLKTDGSGRVVVTDIGGPSIQGKLLLVLGPGQSTTCNRRPGIGVVDGLRRSRLFTSVQ